jgi:hypothetical protein
MLGRKKNGVKSVALGIVLILVSTQSQPAFSANEAPEYCGTSGLTEAQETACAKAKGASNIDQVGNIQLAPPKYPAFIQLLGLNDEYNLNKAVEVNLIANTDRQIKIQYRNSDLYILIPSERIVRWDTGQGSKVDASGAIGMAAGAIFFPPMLLAAPFGIKNIKTNQYQIQYIDPYGNAKTLSLTATLFHKETLSILRYASGLKPGISRDDGAVKAILEKTLTNLIEQRDKKAMELLVINPQKPWCEHLDTKKNEEVGTRYRQLNEYIVTLSTKLKVPYPAPKVESTQDEKWSEYVNNKPDLKKWSSAFPTQAAKLKTCPAISN